jgi:hypothetical protein
LFIVMSMPVGLRGERNRPRPRKRHADAGDRDARSGVERPRGQGRHPTAAYARGALGEAVARPLRRRAAETGCQGGVLTNEPRRARPRRNCVERLDETGTYEGASAVSLPSCPAKLVKLCA